jgi:hypothetical protein
MMRWRDKWNRSINGHGAPLTEHRLLWCAKSRERAEEVYVDVGQGHLLARFFMQGGHFGWSVGQINSNKTDKLMR